MPDETRTRSEPASEESAVGNTDGGGSDIIAGLVLLGLCAIAYLLTTNFAEVPEMLSQNVPPTFFPRVVLVATALLSVGLAINGWRERGARVASSEPKKRRSSIGGLWLTASICFFTVVLAPRLGMLITIALMSVAFSLGWGERDFKRIALLAVGLPASIYVIFGVAFGMRFPDALLF